jgi:hypothetical protein
MSENPDSVVNQGQFHGRVAPSEPLTTKGVSLNVFPFYWIFLNHQTLNHHVDALSLAPASTALYRTPRSPSFHFSITLLPSLLDQH